MFTGKMSVFSDIIIYIFVLFEYVVYSFLWNIFNIFHYAFLWDKLSDENTICAFRVISRYKFRPTEFSSSRDFITIYDECVRVEYLLQDNVSLYCMAKDHTYFVETNESVNVFRSETNAFLYTAQFENAVRLFRMRTSLFIELANKIGNPKVKACCIFNTGRCGSTVLAQALEKIPGTLLLSEPESLLNLGLIWKSRSLTQSQYEIILVAIVRFLCKPYNGISLVIIKTRSHCTCHIDALRKHFPNFKIMFMYRNLMSTTSSFLRIPRINKTSNYVRTYLLNSDAFSVLFPWLRRNMYYKKCVSLQDCPSSEVADRMNEVELLTYSWASNINVVRKFLQDGGHVLLTTYEELMDKKIETMKTILVELDINHKHIKTAMEAFDQDSQVGTILSWDNKEEQSKGVITESDRVKACKVLFSFGLPDINEHVNHFFSNVNG